MNTIRIADSGFSVIENEIFRNKEISARAKGIYAYFRTCSPDWEVPLVSLKQFFKEGRDAIRTALRELETHGYIKRERYRLEGGEFAWRLVVFAVSQNADATIDGFSGHGTIDGKSGDGKSGDGFSGHIINKRNNIPPKPPKRPKAKPRPEENGLRPLEEVEEDLKEFFSIFPDHRPTRESAIRQIHGIMLETLDREKITREELLSALRECRELRDNWTDFNLQWKRGLKSILANETWKDREFWETRLDPAKRADMEQANRDRKVKDRRARHEATVEKFIQRAHHGEDRTMLYDELSIRGVPFALREKFHAATAALA